jgi:hypothetical protein
MNTSVLGLSIDCADAVTLAQFWADVLDRPVSPRATAEFATESDRLLSLGATRVADVERDGAHWTTFRDPEGNEFDLVAG